jgi:hypothetical protein
VTIRWRLPVSVAVALLAAALPASATPSGQAQRTCRGVLDWVSPEATVGPDQADGIGGDLHRRVQGDPDNVAGEYWDPCAGQFVFQTTTGGRPSPSTLAGLQSSSKTFRVDTVKHSARELADTFGILNVESLPWMDALGARKISVRVDEPLNKVVLGVDKPTDALVATVAARFGDIVLVTQDSVATQQSRSNDVRPWYGGDPTFVFQPGIPGYGTCTLGPGIGRLGGTTTFNLTAGHCGINKSLIYHPTSSCCKIGSVSQDRYASGQDSALLQGIGPEPSFAGWIWNTDNVAVRVTSYAPGNIGSAVRMSGGTSGLQTGLTIQTDPNSPYCTYIAEGPNGVLHYTCGIVKYVKPITGGYGQFSASGDSGAPVVSLSSINSIAVYFLRGIHIAGGKTSTDYFGLYMNLSAALAPHGTNFYPLTVAVP